MFKSDQARSNKGLPFGAIVLIALGAVFLLNNFGVLPWDIWQNIWKFWPVLLILIGVEFVLGRPSSFKIFLLLLALIFIVPIVLILNPLTRNPLANGTATFEKPLGNLTKASFIYKLPSNNLTISALKTTSSKSFESSVKYSKALPTPTLTTEQHFGEASYTFSQPYRYVPFASNLGNTIETKISPLIPIEINSTSTAGVFQLNLTSLKANLVTLESTTGQIEIDYSKDFSNKTYLKTTAANITLKIPKEIDARVKIESLVKNIKIDQNRFKQTDNTYQTANFPTSTLKIDIEISGSASSVTIK
ncbi:MAG TPA: DUF5668 domain-containing protein [Candidatus Saccharimonadales bacterium]|nr:DUF5668 domain-containing protein [Candidatus Saccharimonadales bacterium]